MLEETYVPHVLNTNETQADSTAIRMIEIALET